MPVIFEKQIETAKKLAVWHITESEAELFKLNHFIPNPEFTLKRNIELAVSRILLNHLVGVDAHLNLTKDKFGKPFLNHSDIAVSFSHSHRMVACIVDLSGMPVGIDIEMKRDRITLMADKFCTKRDLSEQEGVMHYHLVWGGKEVLYKIYAKKELDFKKHLNVVYNSESGTGMILKDGTASSYRLGWSLINDYILVWGY